MGRRSSNLVVVITGASSGIGRETARRFALEGARVVLAARRAEVLQSLASDLGPQTLAVPTDVTDESSVERLADEAVRAFGRIDVWVNNAGVLAMGSFLDIPSNVFRKVVETNFFGSVHGARAALKRFKSQGSGVLINVASIEAKTSTPYATAYAASKQAVRGFVEALQAELALEEASGIEVCLVVPATIDTPLFENTANYTGYKVLATNPVYGPERVASAIVNLVQQPRRKVLVGTSARPLSALSSLVRGTGGKTFSRLIDDGRLDHRVRAESTPGNVLSPANGRARTTGGWRAQERSRLRQVLAIAAPSLALAGLGLYLLSRRAAKPTLWA
jgi:short-subunit dehydrogenase